MLAPNYPVQRRRPIGQHPAVSLADIAWRLTWPFVISNILAGVMIICTLVIGALEIASLAKSTSKTSFGNTSSTGAGIWCGFFFLIAAVLIVLLNWARATRLWATIALIGTIVAACFAIILLGLDSKAVHDGKNIWGSLPDKSKVLAAQLSFAIFEFLLCLAFIGIYIAVLISAPRRLRIRQQQQAFGF